MALLPDPAPRKPLERDGLRVVSEVLAVLGRNTGVTGFLTLLQNHKFQGSVTTY